MTHGSHRAHNLNRCCFKIKVKKNQHGSKMTTNRASGATRGTQIVGKVTPRAIQVAQRCQNWFPRSLQDSIRCQNDHPRHLQTWKWPQNDRQRNLLASKWCQNGRPRGLQASEWCQSGRPNSLQASPVSRKTWNANSHPVTNNPTNRRSHRQARRNARSR